MIDARSLHKWLGPKERYNDWIKRRFADYGFAEAEDFVCYRRASSGRGGHNRKDYLLTIDMAKELAMVERTDIGRETRRTRPTG